MPKRFFIVAALAALLPAGWAVAQQNPTFMYMVPVMMVPVTPVPVIMVQPVMVQPVVMQPIMAAPISAAPVADEGNMLSRLIARIDVQTDNEIRNGPEGPAGIVDYRPPPAAPAPVMAMPVALVTMGPTAQGIYTVRSGGSLHAVARRTGATLADLLALNPEFPADRKLTAGTQVRLPFPWSQ